MAVIPTKNEFAGTGGVTIPTSGEFVKVPDGNSGSPAPDDVLSGVWPVGKIRTESTNSDYLFAKNTRITEIFAENLTSINYDVASNMTGLTTFVAPKMTTVAGSAFQKDTALAAVDILGGGYLNNYAFRNDSQFIILLLRASDRLTGVSDNAFQGTPFAAGGAGGTIYIPKTLYDHLGDGTPLDYKAATNWSTYDAYGTITWAQIEGSAYETRYADGTPIE